MASKAAYYVFSAIGAAAAAMAAWWYQSAGSAPRVVLRPSAEARLVVVEVAPVRRAVVVDEVQALGSLRSRQSVVLRPEVAGRITGLHFRDGERVRQGQLLVQLDNQLPRAQVQQAQAERAIAQANHQRNQELVAQGFVSQRALDESAANVAVAQARLVLAEATAARLKIVAPFDGWVGIRSVSVGDYLKDGADIVNLEDMEALYVDFRLPERLQSKVQRGQHAKVEVDALPGQSFVSVVQAIDPLLDAEGRSVAVRACIDNRSQQLRPGMFARVNAVFGERSDAQMVPEAAIVPQGQQQFVLRLQAVAGAVDQWVTERIEVQVGLRRAGQVEVRGALAPGDQVVTAGQQRLQRSGTRVQVVAAPVSDGGGAAALAAPVVVAEASEPPALAGRNPCLPG